VTGCPIDDAQPNDDVWATADESPAHILDLYRRVTAFADEAIAQLPLDTKATTGRPTWPGCARWPTPLSSGLG